MVSNATINGLSDIAIRCAVKGAQEFATQRGITLSSDTLLESLRAEVKAAIDPAMDDAKAAFDLGMNQIGEATFAATMFQAGIRAVKAAYGVA